MKLSYFTCATPDWTPAETVARLAEQGWDGVEWRVVDDPGVAADTAPGFWAGNRATWPFTGLADRTGEIAALTRDAGLEISGVGAYVMAAEREQVEVVLAATAAIGATQVRVRVPQVGVGETYPQVFAATREHYAWIADRAATHGVKALVELHHNTIVASASSALRLLEGLDPAHVGVIHDGGNLINEGWERPLWVAQLLGEYLAHVHVKNGAWQPTGTRADGSRRFEFGWTPLDAGQIDIAASLAELREAGYDGWVTCEDFSTVLPLEERTAHNLAFLRACVGSESP